MCSRIQPVTDKELQLNALMCTEDFDSIAYELYEDNEMFQPILNEKLSPLTTSSFSSNDTSHIPPIELPESIFETQRQEQETASPTSSAQTPTSVNEDPHSYSGLTYVFGLDSLDESLRKSKADIQERQRQTWLFKKSRLTPQEREESAIQMRYVFSHGEKTDSLQFLKHMEYHRKELKLERNRNEIVNQRTYLDCVYWISVYCSHFCTSMSAFQYSVYTFTTFISFYTGRINEDMMLLTALTSVWLIYREETEAALNNANVPLTDEQKESKRRDFIKQFCFEVKVSWLDEAVYEHQKLMLDVLKYEDSEGCVSNWVIILLRWARANGYASVVTPENKSKCIHLCRLITMNLGLMNRTPSKLAKVIIITVIPYLETALDIIPLRYCQKHTNLRERVLKIHEDAIEKKLYTNVDISTHILNKNEFTYHWTNPLRNS